MKKYPNISEREQAETEVADKKIQDALADVTGDDVKAAVLVAMLTNIFLEATGKEREIIALMIDGVMAIVEETMDYEPEHPKKPQQSN